MYPVTKATKEGYSVLDNEAKYHLITLVSSNLNVTLYGMLLDLVHSDKELEAQWAEPVSLTCHFVLRKL